MEIKIEGDFDANALREELQETLSPAEPIEFRLVRAHSRTRVVTGLEPLALLAILKGIASLTPLVVALLNYFMSKRKNDGKTRTLKIVAADDSVLSVPENTSAESLSALLDQNPKFKNPKLVTVTVE